MMLTMAKKTNLPTLPALVPGILLLAFLLLLSGCSLGKAPADTTGINLEDYIRICDGASSEYRLVVANSGEYYELARKISLNIESKTGTAPEIIKDRTERAGKEILIGHTNRPESAEAYKSLIGMNDYIIKWFGDHLVIDGATSEALSAAVDYFITRYVEGSSGGVLLLEKNLSEIHHDRYINLVSNSKSSYSIVIADNDSDAANLAFTLSNAIKNKTGSFVKIITDATERSGNEIILGNTNRPESGEANDKLASARDFAITVRDGNIVIAGRDIFVLTDAVNKFLSDYIKVFHEGELMIPDSLNYVYNHEFSAAELLAQRINNIPSGEIKKPVFSTAMIYDASGPDAWYFSLYARVLNFNGRFYAFWASGRINEDDCGQRIMVSVSDDAVNWSVPVPLVDSKMGKASELVYAIKDAYLHDGRMYLYYNSFEYRPEALRYYPDGTPYRPSNAGLAANRIDRTLYLMSTADGITWQAEDIRTVRNDITVTAANYVDTEDAAKRGASQLMEPVAYQAKDGTIFIIYRSCMLNNDNNDGGKNYKWAVISQDGGMTFSQPYPTQFTDSPSRSEFGVLPDGRIFYVGNPYSENGRKTLMLYISEDGINFDEQYLLYDRVDYEQKMSGISKDAGYNYPDAMIWGDHLYIIYTINKEAVEIMKLPLSQFAK